MKNYYYSIAENSQNIKTLKEQIASKQADHDRLAKIKSDLESGTAKNDFKPYLIDFSDSTFLDYFYKYVQARSNSMSIESLTLNAGTVNEFGLHEGSLNLAMNFQNEASMIEMIKYIVYNTDYNFFIHDFSYPYGQTSGPIKVSIPIKVLYK